MDGGNIVTVRFLNSKESGHYWSGKPKTITIYPNDLKVKVHCKKKPKPFEILYWDQDLTE